MPIHTHSTVKQPPQLRSNPKYQKLILAFSLALHAMAN